MSIFELEDDSSCYQYFICLDTVFEEPLAFVHAYIIIITFETDIEINTINRSNFTK